MMCHKLLCYGTLLGLVAGLSAQSLKAAEPVCLAHRGRFNCDVSKDHLVGVETVLDHYALVCSNSRLVLIDLEALPPEGTHAGVHQIEDLDVYSTVTLNDEYVYANLRLGGLAIVHLDPAALTLTLIDEIAEPGVYYEKMSLAGNRLYVAAHAYGLRMYDISDPLAPQLVSSLSEGLDDAFAVAVDGDLAYVADGAGGLKIVDISDEAHLEIVAGENPQSAAGTAQDVRVIGDHVYVASGGAGIGVYEVGDLSSRILCDTPVCAKHLAAAGSYLAVADIGSLEVFSLEPDGSLLPAAREQASRRYFAENWLSIRLWHGVTAWGDQRIVTADWDTVDVYEITSRTSGSQPDITLSTQRIRFKPSGGSSAVQLFNDGAGVLEVYSIHGTESTFTVSPPAATLPPGASVEVTINYTGGQPGDARVLFESNDPDEAILPIEVFGETPYLDPGEAAIPFTVDSWTYNHQTDQFEYGTFDLNAQGGKIVYFHVFGTW